MNEIKIGNVIKIDGIPVYIVSNVAHEVTYTHSIVIYIGYSNDKLYKVSRVTDLYNEEKVLLKASLICESIKNIDNIINAFKHV